MKRFFFLICLLVSGLVVVAQKQYVNIIATGKQAREGISLSGAIPAGMQDFYTSYYGNIVTLGDVINQYPSALQPYVVAVLRSIHDALLATFSEDDRKVYDHLISKTVLMTLPKSMDPREEGGKE